MNGRQIDIETFDLELFKKEANYHETCNGLVLESREEQFLFRKYLRNHGISASGYGLDECDIGRVALVWNEYNEQVWGIDLKDEQSFALVGLEHFCKWVPFISSEEELLNFLNL